MNNREIKFRVWDKQIKRLYPVGGYFWEEGGNNSLNLNDSDYYILQQFTGLFDKNNKEIYEGDIIQYNYPKNKKNNKVLVRWTTEEYDNHPGFIIHDSFEQYGDYEIVGNIYENPELLNDK